jgi:S1-C subfamily serine protease
MRRWAVTWVLLAVMLPALAGAVPVVRAPRVHPRDISELPSFVRRVEPAIVGLGVRVAAESPSAQTLGTRRFASGVVFDPRGYAVTVGYAIVDANAIEARTRDRATVPASLVAIDFESGLGVVKLGGAGPWPTASLGQSQDVVAGALTGTVGIDEDGDIVHVTGAVQAIRRFAAYWEYMLDRAFLVAPGSRSWGGSAVVDARGQVIAVASLRLGEPPHVNLAIPMEKFLPIKDELITLGRVASRPPRPWLGLYTVAVDGAVVVDGFSPSGPARRAGFQRGDRIVGVNGVRVAGQEEFYEQLWRTTAGDEVQIEILRGQSSRMISVRSVDRHRVYRTTSP